jgi:transposase
MNPYSQDLRERVIAALDAGEHNQAEIAETFGVSLSTIEKWWRRWRDIGTCAAFPRNSGPDRTLAGCEDFVRAEVKKQPDATLEELCARVAEAKGVQVSPSMMCRTLQILRLARKKSRFTIANATHRV